MSQLQQHTSEINKNQKIYQLISQLSWEQKFEWVNTRRLKANQLFKSGDVQKAVQSYVQSLIGLQLKSPSYQKNQQVRLQLQFPILMNIAACFYKLKQFQKGIQICNQILNTPQGKQFPQALYKKAYFLYQLGHYPLAKQFIDDKGREILFQLNSKLQENNQCENIKKVSKRDVKQLVAKMLIKTREERKIYQRIFDQQQDEPKSSSETTIQIPTLQYHENFFKRSIIWVRQAVESCYKIRSAEVIKYTDEQQSGLLKNKRG